MEKPRILIIGAGMVGLAQALALAKLDVEIIVLESEQPKLTGSPQELDARTCAINPSSQLFLQQLNVWNKVNPSALSAVEKIQVWDSQTDASISFDCSEFQKNRLATIVVNRALQAALWEAAQACPNIHLHCPETPESYRQLPNSNIEVQTNKNNYQADLIIGADGGHSWLREQLNLNYYERHYEQEAIVAVIECEKLHERSAYQVFHPTGPLALLPLANLHHCAIVWSNDLTRAQELMQLPIEKFNFELTHAFSGRLGFLKCLTERKTIPLLLRDVKQYLQGRAILIGDAAHNIHPLAGQGVNLGLMDAQCLAEKITLSLQQHQTVFYPRLLREFERERKAKNRTILYLMSAFKECFAKESFLFAQVRAIGLQLFDRFSVLKRAIILN